MNNVFKIFILLLFAVKVNAQTYKLSGQLMADGKTLERATVRVSPSGIAIKTDSAGKYSFNLYAGQHQLKVSAVGYKTAVIPVSLKTDTVMPTLELTADNGQLHEVVVTGTQKEVSRLDSPVPVEIYNAQFFRKNPTPSIFEALQNVNGVRPQLNCNICNTGDIHINGLEGPYTMVLIDGMPIVSSLSTVYGLSGIPNSLVDRIEVVKGPASSLYGSEAVGGLINIITKNEVNAPKLLADVMTTSYLETNTDIGFKLPVGKNISTLTGINYFKYGNRVDLNNDNFTDVTLQDRISVFHKWQVKRANNRLFDIAGRYLYEDRWGGDLRWNKSYRGGDEVYGESIYTKRWELIGKYQLPVDEKIFLAFSATAHNQDSRYGTTSYIASQRIAFGQATWDKQLGNHDLLAGMALRYTYYDDNTPATANATSVAINQPEKVALPGIFLQDEIHFSTKNSLLLGARYDYNSVHGNIFTPRFAYRLKFNDNQTIRLNAGTGFRVVNLFTEDHAALTGARAVVIAEELKPEKSYNVNLNYLGKFHLSNGTFLGIDFSGFYTHFNNRIVGDYDTDPNEIIYANLDGHAVSKGITANLDLALPIGLNVNAGATYQNVDLVENGMSQQQILTEKWMGTWAVSYNWLAANLKIDYTGNIYGPMRLPLLGDLDPRKPFSPIWSIQNVQFTYVGFKNLELYGGVKNLLNFLPTKGNPFLIARSNDPFDKNVSFDSNGQTVATPNNPYALTFDPSYVYAPNQGIRGFFGVRYTIK